MSDQEKETSFQEDILKEASPEELKKALEELKKSKKAALISSEERKDYELKVKEEIALKHQLYKKDNTTLDLAKVKIPLFKKAAKIELEEAPNTLEADLEVQEGYIIDMRNDPPVKALAESLLKKLETEKEMSNEAKDVKAELSSRIDKDVVEALDLIAKLEVEKEKEKLDEEKGKKIKPKKDNSDLLRLIEAIRKKLNIH